jgi:hypothetical protein
MAEREGHPTFLEALPFINSSDSIDDKFFRFVDNERGVYQREACGTKAAIEPEYVAHGTAPVILRKFQKVRSH